MKKLMAMLFTIMFAFVSTTTAFAANWRFIDGTSGTGAWKDGKFFLAENNYVIGSNSQVQIDGSFYRFNDAGGVIQGWFQEPSTGLYYYYEPAAHIGWFQDTNGAWYYFNNEGEMLTNTTTPDGYWVGSNGVWDGSRGSNHRYSSSSSRTSVYHNSGNGNHDVSDKIQKSGWYESNGNFYYLKNGYAIAEEWKKVNGHWYYFDEDGVMLTEWQELEGYNDATSGIHTFFFNDGSTNSCPYGALVKSRYVDGVHIDKNGVADND